MINHKIVPGVLTWPTTSQVIEETRTENLQVCLNTKITVLFSQMVFPEEKEKRIYFTKLCNVTCRVSFLICSSPHTVRAKESGEQKQGEIQHGEGSAVLIFLSTVNSKPGLS